MEDDPHKLIPTRQSLLSRLKNWDDSGSWQDFFKTYWKLIYGVSIKAGLSHAEAQDVVQETILGVAKAIGRFRYEPQACSFKSWLLQVTRKRIASQIERRNRQPVALAAPLETTRGTPLLEKLPDAARPALESLWDAEWEKNLMDAGLSRLRQRVSTEQYQIFDLYVLKNWPAGEVARALQVSLPLVYVTKHRLARLLQKEIATLEKEFV